MSGHSKWSTIKRAKGVTDIKRGQTFTKLANAISIAARMGGSSNPDDNPRLRMIIDEARSVNMPKDNIQRAAERGMGRGEGQAPEEVLYEGFGPGKVAFIVEGVTDNKMRTTQEVKNIFERGGGSLVGQGSVVYMFDRKGEIKVQSSKVKVQSEEDEILQLIDLGAEDIESFEEDGIRKYLVYTESSELNTMGNKITHGGYGVESQELIYKPNILVEIKDPEMAQKVLDFTERLESLDDVQKVYANFDYEF